MIDSVNQFMDRKKLHLGNQIPFALNGGVFRRKSSAPTAGTERNKIEQKGCHIAAAPLWSGVYRELCKEKDKEPDPSFFCGPPNDVLLSSITIHSESVVPNLLAASTCISPLFAYAP